MISYHMIYMILYMIPYMIKYDMIQYSIMISMQSTVEHVALPYAVCIISMYSSM